MEDEALNLNQDYFNNRAARHHAAFAAAPFARTFEILSFLYFLGSGNPSLRRKDAVLGDLLCGDGYFSGHLDGCFRHVYGVDLSSGLLGFFPKSETASCIVEPVTETTNILEREVQPDFLVSMAGLHHIYSMVDGEVDASASDQKQIEVLSNWMKAVPDGGKMIVGDIPDSDSTGEFVVCDKAEEFFDDDLTRRGQAIRESLAREINLPRVPVEVWPERFGDFVGQIQNLVECVESCSPASWFREVAAKQNPQGHIDHFPSVNRLKSGLEENGLNVDYYDIPTPLMFGSKDSALRFMHEAFGLGNQIETAADLSNDTRDKLEANIIEHLGIKELNSGQVFVGWRSAFYVVTHQQ